MKILLNILIFSLSLFGQVDYNLQIQPIFDINCTACHIYGGAATLNLSSYNGVMSGGVSGPSITDGDHVNSELFIRITLPVGTDGSMPPNYPLSQSDIDLIAQLIDEGATLGTGHIKNIPQNFSLYQNYPNPFNPTTLIRYDLPKDDLVSLRIYDMMGRLIKTLVKKSQIAGYKSIQWNGTNNQNKTVPAGLYLYIIESGEFRQSKKMILLK